MKKGISLTVFAGVCACGAYLILDKPTPVEAISNEVSTSSATVAEQKKATSLFKPSNQTNSKATELAKLKLAKRQCKQQSLKATQAAADHSPIEAAIKQALKDGDSLEDILSYSELVKISYRSFSTLVINAIKQNAEQQFQYASSVNILKSWQGIEVIDYFDIDTINQLTAIDGPLSQNTGSMMFNVPLPEQVNKTALYKLLDNNDDFNTYLKTPFKIGPSRLISPSILFLVNAHALSLTEFENAISSKEFTVNDIAVALKSNLPNDYLTALISQTAQLNGSPTAMSDDFIDEQLYLNLADVAVSEFNVPILKLLSERGIEPTNQPNVFTAMDIAIVNLKGSSNSEVQPLESKHLETLSYLKNKGYRAHGELVRDTPNDRLLMLKSSFLPSSLLFVGDQVANDAFSQFIDLKLIPNNLAFKRKEKDNSAISKALSAYELQKQQAKKVSPECETIDQRIYSLEAIKTRSQALEELETLEAQQGLLTPNTLQEIDPVQVHNWQFLHSNEYKYQTSTQYQTYKEAIVEKDFNTVATITQTAKLSTHQTNMLLAATIENAQQLTSIWQNRVAPTAPENLYLFTKLPLAQWQTLADNGFDFSLKDMQNNDMYFYASMHSKEAVKFLMSLAVAHDFSKPGLDILDQALEQSYNTQTLADYMPSALKLVDQYEPNHFRRAERLKIFVPDVYEELIKLEPKLAPKDGTVMNNYLYSAY